MSGAAGACPRCRLLWRYQCHHYGDSVLGVRLPGHVVGMHEVILGGINSQQAWHAHVRNASSWITMLTGHPPSHAPMAMQALDLWPWSPWRLRIARCAS